MIIYLLQNLSKYLNKDLDQAASLGINQSNTGTSPSIYTKIQIKKLSWIQIKARQDLVQIVRQRFKSKVGLQIDQRKPGARPGTQKLIGSIARWIWIDQVEPGLARQIGSKYNFLISYLRSFRLYLKSYLDSQLTP